MKSEFLKFGAIGLAAILIQLLLFKHLRYGPVEIDFVLLVLIWVMARKDRTTALLFAAYVGFLSDFFYDLWGIHLLSKTVIAFFAYPFIPKIEESKLFFTQVFLLLFVIILAHHFIFLFSTFFTQIYDVKPIFFPVLLGSTLLTAFFGSIIYLFKDQ